MSEQITDKVADAILAEVNEMQRLGQLSDNDLLLECLRSDVMDYMVVQEVLNRWKPNWLQVELD